MSCCGANTSIRCYENLNYLVNKYAPLHDEASSDPGENGPVELIEQRLPNHVEAIERRLPNHVEEIERRLAYHVDMVPA